MLLPKASIFLLWLSAVFDPIGNFFGLRYIALGLAALTLGWVTLTRKYPQVECSLRSLLVLVLTIVMPTYGIILYAINANGGEFIDTSYIASGALILSAYLYRDDKDCTLGIDCFVIVSRLLTIIVFFGFLSQVFYSSDWMSFFTERNVALVSFREYAGFNLPYIYFLASPLLILLLAYDWAQLKHSPGVVRYVFFACTTLALALTGTRAHLLIAIFFIPLTMLITSNHTRQLKALLLALGVGVVLLTLEDTRQLLFSFFSAAETSNSMKLSLLDGYSEIFQNPMTLLFGQGFNAHEWSAALRDMIAMEDKASKTELSYLELFRVFGVVITACFLGVIALIMLQASKLPSTLHWLYSGFAIYLLNAALNPYLFSVNGMLPLALIASIVYYYQSKPVRGNNSGFPYLIKALAPQ